MEMSPFCEMLQKWIFAERLNLPHEKDAEEMMVVCLRKIMDLENTVEHLEKLVERLSPKPVITRKKLP